MAKKPKATTEASTDERAGESKQPRRTVTRASGFTTYYTNDTRVQTGPWDVRIVLGLVGDGEDDSIQVLQTAEVCMSPQHAKRIVQILERHLKHYEETYGAIPVPLKD